MAENTKETPNTIGEADAPLDRIVPKFCTAINVGVLNNRNVILSLLYTENQSATLIDRIVIDIQHAKGLQKALGEILTEAENEND